MNIFLRVCTVLQPPTILCYQSLVALTYLLARSTHNEATNLSKMVTTITAEFAPCLTRSNYKRRLVSQNMRHPRIMMNLLMIRSFCCLCRKLNNQSLQLKVKAVCKRQVCLRVLRCAHKHAGSHFVGVSIVPIKLSHWGTHSANQLHWCMYPTLIKRL